MRTLFRCFILGFLASPCVFAQLQTLPGPVDTINLSPAGGRWGSIFNTSLVYNATTNRVITIVEDSELEDGFLIVRFDASTNGFAGGAPPLAVPDVPQPIILGTGVSSDGNTFVISWGDGSGGTEVDVPIHLEFFDFAIPSSNVADATRDIQLVRFDMDDSSGRIVGISTPSVPGGAYSLSIVDIETRSVTQEFQIDITAADAVVKEVAYDATTDRLLTLWVPLENGDPTKVKLEGYIKGYNVSTGIAQATSEIFPGEFIQDSLALSEAGRYVAVAARTSATGVPILNADTLATDHMVDYATISSNFSSLGTATFGLPDELWLANDKPSAPDQSLAVYDVAAATVVRFIPGADLAQKMISDEETGKIFGATSKYQQVYILSATSTELSTRIDFTVGPNPEVAVEMGVDTESNVFHVLSHAGGLHLVSDDGPDYLGRLLDFAPDPKAGLEIDTTRNRLFVGRRGTDPPIVLETLGYQTSSGLDRPAEALTLDASRNLLYASRLAGATSISRLIEEIDGSTLNFNRKIADLPPFTFTVADMVVDKERNILWALIYDLLNDLTIHRYDLNGEVQESSASITGTLERTGRVFLDPERNQILILPRAGVPDITSFALDSADLESTRNTYNVDSDFIFDARLEPGEDVLYLLLRGAADTFYKITAADLNSPTLAIESFDLDFLTDSNARFARNPATDRFAVLGGQSGRVYLFDNPFASAEKAARSTTAKALIPNSGAVGQTDAGIELNWQISPEVGDDFRGVTIERRRTEAEPWIRMTPLPIPPSLRFWTDTTVESGQAYDYRIAAVGEAEADSIILHATAPAESRWLPNIPDVVVFLRPGESNPYLLSVADLSGDTDRVMVSIEGDPNLDLVISPQLVPIPGAAEFSITVPQGTTPGVHTAWVTAEDGQTVSRIPLVVRVVPETQILSTDRILRRTTPITLTSDSELDQRRLSIRGQLGLLRRLANPVPVTVEALLPDGTTQEATVIASTGEFTADFSVPEGLADGDWTFLATMPGSLEVVGGRSFPFTMPINTANGKQGNEEKIDLGQILLIAGEPTIGGKGTPTYSNGESRGELQTSVEKLVGRLVRRRFKAGDQIPNETEELANLLITSPSKEAIEKALERISTQKFVFFYFIGDAIRNTPSGPLSFVLNEEEKLGADDIVGYLNHPSILQKATPLVVFDCPFAAEFQTILSANEEEGAHLFGAAANYSDVSFRFDSSQDSVNKSFSRNFLDQLAEHPFGKAFRNIREAWILPFGLVPRSPTGTRYLEPPFFEDLTIGSHFTPPRSLVEDRHTVEFIRTTTSETRELGERLKLFAHTLDYPFDFGAEVQVLVQYPNGTSTTLNLDSTRATSTLGGEIHENSIVLDATGSMRLVFEAVDDSGKIAAQPVMVEVCGGNCPAQDALDLLSFMRAIKENPSFDWPNKYVQRRLFGFAKSWKEPPQE